MNNFSPALVYLRGPPGENSVIWMRNIVPHKPSNQFQCRLASLQIAVELCSSTALVIEYSQSARSVPDLSQGNAPNSLISVHLIITPT